jgi:chemotaxis signal transduction protein
MGAVVRFRVADCAYAVAVESALAVRTATALVPLPQPLPGVTGLLTYEGAVLPVIAALGGGRQVLVLESDRGMFGLLVDDVLGVGAVQADGRGPAPLGQGGHLVAGTARDADGGLLLLLDVGALAGLLA